MREPQGIEIPKDHRTDSDLKGDDQLRAKSCEMSICTLIKLLPGYEPNRTSKKLFGPHPSPSLCLEQLNESIEKKDHKQGIVAFEWAIEMDCIALFNILCLTGACRNKEKDYLELNHNVNGILKFLKAEETAIKQFRIWLQ